MFRPCTWAIFRLRFNLQISYTRCVGHLGGMGDEISLFQQWVLIETTRSRCFNSGYLLKQRDLVSIVGTY